MEIINNGVRTLDDDGYARIDKWDSERTEKLAEHYKAILDLIGENTEREGLLDTPMRVAKAIQFLTKGYNIEPKDILKSAIFREDYKQMEIVKEIEIYSMC